MAVFDLGYKIIARPNNSLPLDGGIKLLAAMFIVTLLIALGFAQIGAWMVLPFAGMELMAFAGAFYYVYLHASDYESISIEEDKVIVEKKCYKKSSVTVFQRYWTQVNVRGVVNGQSINSKSGLFIGSHGKEIEFGEHLIDDEQRVALARELKQKFRNVH
ncbi:MAG: DUF2244 domain-containing protein [Methylotenera sp.]